MTDGLNGTGSALLTLEGVRKSWGEREVLGGVDLEIQAGTMVSVAGANGSGKTTLLRIATGMIIPDRGRTSFRGVDIERDLAAYQRHIGFLSAGDRGLYARLTVRQNLDLWGGLAGLSRRECRRCADGVLSKFEIVELADRRADRLSMGQRQRVRLAMTFLHDPVVVILDEPATSLDEAGVSLLDDALADVVGQGGAALLASPEPRLPFPGQSWLLRSARLQAVDAQPVEPGRSDAAAGQLATPGART